jgi:ABC-type oligopeptide transport system substrate-binding subunit
MNKTKLMRILGMMVVVALLLAVFTVSSAQDKKVLVTTVSMVGGDIPTLDPGVAETSSSIEVINQMFI